MKRLFSWVVLAALVAAAGPASASMFVAMGQQELVRASEAVVVGEVIGVRAFWNDEGTAVLTEADLRVDEVLVGDAPFIVTVQTFGGTVGRLRIDALGFPTFHTGENLVLYLENVQGKARVVGYQQGEYRLVDRRGVRVAVPAVDAGAHLVHLDGTAAARPVSMSLAHLKDQIDAAALSAGRRIRNQ